MAIDTPVIKQLNLSTYKGWMAKATQLLDGKPYGTALADHNSACYYLLQGKQIVKIEALFETDICNPETTFCESDSIQLEQRDWDTHTWDANDAAKALFNPVFVNLKLMPSF